MGKILVPAWRDEPEELVVGLHEALVDEATYHRVQRRFEVDCLLAAVAEGAPGGTGTITVTTARTRASAPKRPTQPLSAT